MKILILTILTLTVAMLSLSISMDKADKVSMSKADSMNNDMAQEMKTGEIMTKKNRYTVPSDTELRKQLTPIQYNVTRENGTERPFDNTYWDNKQPGIYVDIISGEPLFSSRDKYKSGTGWPSFIQPLEPGNIIEKTDSSFFTTRTEIRSKHADAHLGHVFNDGPEPTGLRYCMNSAAMRFIPQSEMEKEGYGDYLTALE